MARLCSAEILAWGPRLVLLAAKVRELLASLLSFLLPLVDLVLSRAGQTPPLAPWALVTQVAQLAWQSLTLHEVHLAEVQ